MKLPRTAWRIWTIVALGIGMSGCGPISWTRITLNKPLHTRDVSFIKPGETKWDEVTARLGPPSELRRTADGMSANYYYYDSRRFDVDFGWGAGFFLPPGASEAPHELDFTTSTIDADTFQVAFDQKGVVQYGAFSDTATAAQFKPSPF